MLSVLGDFTDGCLKGAVEACLPRVYRSDGEVHGATRTSLSESRLTVAVLFELSLGRVMGTFLGRSFSATSLPAVSELLADTEVCSLCHWSNEDANSEVLKMLTLSILSSVWRVALFCSLMLLLTERL